MLMLLVLLLLAIPLMYVEHELRERQRALDRRIKKTLAPTSVPASAPIAVSLGRAVLISGDIEARSHVLIDPAPRRSRFTRLMQFGNLATDPRGLLRPP